VEHKVVNNKTIYYFNLVTNWQLPVFMFLSECSRTDGNEEPHAVPTKVKGNGGKVERIDATRKRIYLVQHPQKSENHASQGRAHIFHDGIICKRRMASSTWGR
jgi:hypothetical protein